MRILVISTLAALALAGCSNGYGNAPVYSGSSYAPQPACNNSTAGVLGGLAGAGGGAYLGNQFGKGTGNKVATGLGALVGGVGGYAAGNQLGGC